jgi:hypothetical protein
MNLWSFLSLVVGAIYLIGFSALVYCAKRAPEGYEGADGFRLGTEPVAPTLPRTSPTNPPMPTRSLPELAEAA